MIGGVPNICANPTAPILPSGLSYKTFPSFTLSVVDNVTGESVSVVLTPAIVKESPTLLAPYKQPQTIDARNSAVNAIIAEATGGCPPYRCVLDSGGFQPIGMQLVLDAQGRCRLSGQPNPVPGGAHPPFRVCLVDQIGNNDCTADVTVLAPLGGGSTGGGGFDGSYTGSFAANSPIGPSSGPITIRVSNGVATLSPPGASFGGNVASNGTFDGFWNNCPGAGCVNFPVSGTFSTTSQFQLSGQNGSGSESVTITLQKD